MTSIPTQSNFLKIPTFFVSLATILILGAVCLLPSVSTSALSWDDFTRALIYSNQTSVQSSNYCQSSNTHNYTSTTNNNITTFEVYGKIYNPTSKPLYFKLETASGYIGSTVRAATQNPVVQTFKNCSEFIKGNNTYSFKFDTTGLESNWYKYSISFDPYYYQPITGNIYISNPTLNITPSPSTVSNYALPTYLGYPNSVVVPTETFPDYNFYGHTNTNSTLKTYLNDLKQSTQTGTIMLDYKCGNYNDLSLLTRYGGQSFCGEYNYDTKMKYVMEKYASSLGYTVGDENFMAEIRDNQNIIFTGTNGYWYIDFYKLASAMDV